MELLFRQWGKTIQINPTTNNASHFTRKITWFYISDDLYDSSHMNLMLRKMKNKTCGNMEGGRMA